MNFYLWKQNFKDRGSEYLIKDQRYYSVQLGLLEQSLK